MDQLTNVLITKLLLLIVYSCTKFKYLVFCSFYIGILSLQNTPATNFRIIQIFVRNFCLKIPTAIRSERGPELKFIITRTLVKVTIN